MVAGVSNLYNISSSIQSNATLNRAVMEVGGIEIPFAIMANNRDERIERFIRAAFFVTASFVAPVVTMPIFNKFFSKRDGIVKNDKEIAILRVSKEYLTGNADKMTEGFKKTAEILKKDKDKEKFTDIDKHFNNVLERFPNKEILRQKLAKTHSKIFLADFLVASLAAISVPWISNFITEKRTKRAGYVGEFEIADSKYTDKMSEKHDSLKKAKIGVSVAIPILASFGISKALSNSMLKPEEKLGQIGKFLKKNAHMFDYKNTRFMSRAGYFAVMLAGDMPSYMLACRDKHELKMRATGWAFALAMLFGGDFVLNNLVGRASDSRFGTNLMNRKGYENAGFFKKFLMGANSLDKINQMGKAAKKTKNAALVMYWGNFVVTTALLGFGLPFITNRQMKKDVKKDLKQQKIK